MKTYTRDEVIAASLPFFKGDIFAADTFIKYALSVKKGEFIEQTPADMLARVINEFVRAEAMYPNPLTREEITSLLATVDPTSGKIVDFGTVIPQGSPLSALGNLHQYQSLSNCFVIEPPCDSYAGIMLADEHLAQIMKRRGGVGVDISNIRPKDMPTTNAACTTDGIGVFMQRYSNTCGEVAQGGRRGALMLTISCFDGSTLIFTEDGWQRIDIIVDGAYSGRVWTHEGWKEIEAYQKFDDSEMYEVEAENGKVIRVTADHQFVVKNIDTNEEYLKAIRDVDPQKEELVFYDLSFKEA